MNKQGIGPAVGQAFFYPGTGTVVCKGTEENEFGGVSAVVYVFADERHDAILRVSVGKFDAGAVIPLSEMVSEKSFEKAMKILKGKRKVRKGLWSRREKAYLEEINSGYLNLLTGALRDLHREDDEEEKAASYSERMLLEKACGYLFDILGHVWKKNDEQVAKRLQKETGKNFRAPPRANQRNVTKEVTSSPLDADRHGKRKEAAPVYSTMETAAAKGDYSDFRPKETRRTHVDPPAAPPKTKKSRGRTRKTTVAPAVSRTKPVAEKPIIRQQKPEKPVTPAKPEPRPATRPPEPKAPEVTPVKKIRSSEPKAEVSTPSLERDRRVDELELLLAIETDKRVRATAEADGLREQVVRQNQSLLESKARANQLEQQVETLKRRLTMSGSELEQKENELSKLREQLTMTRQRSNGTASSKLEAKVRELAVGKKQAQQDLEKLKKQLQPLREARDKLQANEAEVARLQNDLDKLSEIHRLLQEEHRGIVAKFEAQAAVIGTLIETPHVKGANGELEKEILSLRNELALSQEKQAEAERLLEQLRSLSVERSTDILGTPDDDPSPSVKPKGYEDMPRHIQAMLRQLIAQGVIKPSE